MNILLYLSELLQQRTIVGVAGVGTFSKKKFAGRYDKEKQSFLPPGYTLQFAPEVTETENLSIYISEKRNISIESTDYYIAQFAEEISKKLEIEHEAELENIGRLFYTEHDGLSFEPSKNINYGSEFFGLPAIDEELDTVLPEQEIVKQSDLPENNDETDLVYDEIAEAPSKDSHLTLDDHSTQNVPVIENIELDEVKDDLKNTLPTSPEQESTEIEHEEISVPESVIEQHEEHPNRFGHQPESEQAPIYVNLDDDVKAELPIVEAPEFIKEQHADHPNRFGHDPMVHEEYPIEEENGSMWTKIWIGIIILIVIVAILFFAKPDLFKSPKTEFKPQIILDTPEVKKVDTNQLKKDSIAKTDSILKANQVLTKKDSIVKKTTNTVSKTAIITFDVIGASYKTGKGAEKYISIMKKNGYDAKIAKMSGPWKKVSIASFKTEKEAKEQKDILQKKLKGSGFYVQQINTTP